jgi:hypothetical protein
MILHRELNHLPISKSELLCFEVKSTEVQELVGQLRVHEGSLHSPP